MCDSVYVSKYVFLFATPKCGRMRCSDTSCFAGKGAGKGAGSSNPAAKGTNINVGWNKTRGPKIDLIGDADYLAAFQHVVMPAARMFDGRVALSPVPVV